MKNTLTIKIGDSEQQCSCECLDSVYNGENSIFVALVVPNDTNPKLFLYVNGELNKSVHLKEGQFQTIEIGSDFSAYADKQLSFQYASVEKVGSMFTIDFPTDLTGNMMLKRVDDYTYNAQFTNYNKEISSGNDCDCDCEERFEKLEKEMEELFQSVSSGKKEIASAITDKGVSTEYDATFSEMAENISKIQTTPVGEIDYATITPLVGVIADDYEENFNDFSHIYRMSEYFEMYDSYGYFRGDNLASFLGMQCTRGKASDYSPCEWSIYHNAETQNGFKSSKYKIQLKGVGTRDVFDTTYNSDWFDDLYMGCGLQYGDDDSVKISEVYKVGSAETFLFGFENSNETKSGFLFGATKGVNPSTNAEEWVYFVINSKITRSSSGSVFGNTTYPILHFISETDSLTNNASANDFLISENRYNSTNLVNKSTLYSENIVSLSNIVLPARNLILKNMYYMPTHKITNSRTSKNTDEVGDKQFSLMDLSDGVVKSFHILPSQLMYNIPICIKMGVRSDG